MTTTTGLAETHPPVDFESVLRARMPNLTRSAQAIAHVILTDPRRSYTPDHLRRC